MWEKRNASGTQAIYLDISWYFPDQFWKWIQQPLPKKALMTSGLDLMGTGAFFTLRGKPPTPTKGREIDIGGGEWRW